MNSHSLALTLQQHDCLRIEPLIEIRYESTITELRTMVNTLAHEEFQPGFLFPFTQCAEPYEKLFL